MATTIVKTIGSGGGRDYSTITAWEAAIPADLVTADEVWEGQCYNDAPFPENVDIAGHTTDSTRFIRLTVASGQGHNGTEGTGVRIHSNGVNGVPITAQDDYTELVHLETYGAVGGLAQQGYGVRVVAQGVTVRDHISHDNARDGYTGWNSTGSGLTKLVNVVCYGNGASGFQLASNSGTGAETCENCTAWSNSSYGFENFNNVQIVKNCIAIDNTLGDFETGLDTTASTNNGSGDTSAPGGSPVTGLVAATEFVSATSGTEDLHLKSGAVSIDKGTALTYASDIDGDARPQGVAWDIGADEFVSAGITATTDSLTITEQSADINLNKNVQASTDTLNITGQAADINLNKNVSVAQDSLSIAEYAADINLNKNINASTDSLTITEYPASITTGANVIVNATTDALLITENKTTVQLHKNITVATDSLSITEIPAAISLGVNIVTGPPVSLIISEIPTDINLNKNVTASTASLNITEYAANVVLATINTTIDGQSSYIISTNYGAITIYNEGGKYYII